MTIPEKYLKHYNLKLIDNESGWHVLLPFLVIDVMQQIFYKEINVLPFKHELNHARKAISKEYKEFNSLFWKIFNQEETDRIIDIMDEFTSAVEDSITIARVQIMNEMKDMSTEQQKICSAMDMCNILSKLANIFWQNIFGAVAHMKSGDKHITGIEHYTKKLFTGYFSTNSSLIVNQNDNQAIVDSVNNITRKMVAFIKDLK